MKELIMKDVENYMIMRFVNITTYILVDELSTVRVSDNS
jgi:hypothetical protein